MIEDKRELAGRIVGTGEAWLTELSTDRLREVVALSRTRWARRSGGGRRPVLAREPPPGRAPWRAGSRPEPARRHRRDVVVEALHRDPGIVRLRLPAGARRHYARRGQVLDLDVSAGVVEARVQGSRPRPYRVRLAVGTLSERTGRGPRRRWRPRRCSWPAAGRRDAAGDRGGVRGLQAVAVPTASAQLSSSCSCPDWASPCKHVAAVFYLLAEEFDRDPFQVFKWRGRSREELLEHLAELREEAEPGATTSQWGRTQATPRRRQIGSGGRPRAGGGADAPLGAGERADASIRRLGAMGVTVAAWTWRSCSPRRAGRGGGGPAPALGDRDDRAAGSSSETDK